MIGQYLWQVSISIHALLAERDGKNAKIDCAFCVKSTELNA